MSPGVVFTLRPEIWAPPKGTSKATKVVKNLYFSCVGFKPRWGDSPFKETEQASVSRWEDDNP